MLSLVRRIKNSHYRVVGDNERNNRVEKNLAGIYNNKKISGKEENMKNFFNLDSSFMIFLSNLVDVIILNVVCLICCIPIVTIGPAMTAMHYVTLKMVKNENTYTVKTFFRAFKDNLKQSMIVWLIFLAVTVVCAFDLKILQALGMNENRVFVSIIGAIYMFVCLTTMYIFPILARFENSLFQTIKNSFLMCILNIGKTIVMAIIYILPFVILPLDINMVAAFLLLGLSGPAYINSYIWKSIFKKYEPNEEVQDIE